jgi:chromatin segregation and condensation protein Rec8/ScpA/Scc1 (kleisin family)
VDWFESQPSGQARAALFLALLELARKGVLLLYQDEDFAPIRVKALRDAPGESGSGGGRISLNGR